MNAEILQMISVVAFALAGILAVTATFLYFRLNVRGISDDLSGKTAERQIRELREQNRRPEGNSNGKILYQTPKEKSTEKLAAINERTSPLSERIKGRTGRTEKMSAQDESTVVLVKEDENTTVLGSDDEGTTVLGSDDEGTTVLETEYRLVMDEMMLHTDERIL